MVTHMPDETLKSGETLGPGELDSKLLTLFAESREPLPDAEFIRTFLAGLERVRRMRTMSRIAMTILAVGAGLWIMPSVLHHTAGAVHAVSQQSTHLAPLVISPVGWAVSMLIGFLVILRTGALRRRRTAPRSR
jgi:hypothetical protein